jgi:citrate lyase subunit beta / citryl-CoA lyase
MMHLRSVLYVPGDQQHLFRKAEAADPDAILLDLEDSVAEDRKADARMAVVNWLSRSDRKPGMLDLVRINGLGRARYDDLAAIVPARPDALVLPKVETVERILQVDHVLSYLENCYAMLEGTIELILILETAVAIADCRQLASCTQRVASVVGGAAWGGDVNRSIGYRWSSDGTESLYLRSHVVLEARAAGIKYPLYCGWMNIRNLEGLEEDARRNRALGYAGALVIHPSHVPVMNQVFSLTSDEIERYRRLLKVYEAAEAEGVAAVDFEGELVDAAMARTAREALSLRPAD